MTEPSLLTTAQAAELLGVTPAHVRRLAARGALPCEETPLGRLYRRAEIERRREQRPRRGRPAGRPQSAQPTLVEVRLTKRVRFQDGSRAEPGQVLSYKRPADAQALIDAGVGETVAR